MKKTFIVYSDWYEYTEGMTDKQKANLFDCIRTYTTAYDCIDPLPEIRFVRNRIKNMLDKHQEEYEKICKKNKDNARKRWGNKENATAYDRMPNMLDNDNETVNDNKKENNKVKTLSKDKEAKAFGNEEVNLCLEIIKKVNGGIVDGTVKEQRQYSKLLVGKIKKIDTVLSGKRSWDVYLSGLMAIVSKSKYDIRKITSPKKIYYDLASLQQVANQQVVEEKQTKEKTSEAFRSFGM